MRSVMIGLVAVLLVSTAWGQEELQRMKEKALAKKRASR